MADNGKKTTLLSLKIMAVFFIGTNLLRIIFSAVYFKQIGLSVAHVGIVHGASPLSSAIGGIIFGYIADRADLRKPIFTFSYLAYAVTPILATFPKPEYVCNETHLLNGNKTSNFKQIKNHTIAEHLNHFGNTSQWRNFRYHGMTEGNVNEMKQLQAKLQRNQRKVSVQEYSISKEDKSEIGKLHVKSDLHKRSPIKTKNEQRLDNEQSLFVAILIVTIIGDFLSGASINMIDSLVVMSLDDQKQYGTIRLWGNIGQVVIIPSIALITYFKTVDICSKSVNDFAFALLSTSLISMTGWFYALFKVYFPSSQVTENNKYCRGEGTLKELITPLETWSVLINAFFYGAFESAITSFLFLTMVELDPTVANLSIAVANFIRNGAAFFTYLLVAKLLHAIGYRNAFNLACLTYGCSFIVTAVMSSPWLGILVELLASSSYALSMSACVSYIGEIAHPSLAVTAQGEKVT